jgi:hypothetical protein
MKIGDKVIFVSEDRHIPHFYSAGIPSSKIRHGNTTVGKHYMEHGAKIVDIYKEYFIVAFIDTYNKEVRLGFKEESLKLAKVTNWREKIEGK